MHITSNNKNIVNMFVHHKLCTSVCREAFKLGNSVCYEIEIIFSIRNMVLHCFNLNLDLQVIAFHF